MPARNASARRDFGIVSRKMALADQILELARAGHSTAEIAASLDVRFNRVRSVVGKAGLQLRKPPLTAEALLAGGFTFLGNWQPTTDGRISIDHVLPEAAGTYAFVADGVAVYVGVATAGLGRRLRMYTRSSERRKTWARIHGRIKHSLDEGVVVEVYVAKPPDLEWNGLPVHGGVGLELGLIQRFDLPWNTRGTV